MYYNGRLLALFFYVVDASTIRMAQGQYERVLGRLTEVFGLLGQCCHYNLHLLLGKLPSK